MYLGNHTNSDLFIYFKQYINSDLWMVQIIYQGTKDYYPEFKAHTGNQETESAELTMTITDLYPGTKYTFVVIAETHCGYGRNSSVVQESTEVHGKLFTVYRVFIFDMF